MLEYWLTQEPISGILLYKIEDALRYLVLILLSFGSISINLFMCWQHCCADSNYVVYSVQSKWLIYETLDFQLRNHMWDIPPQNNLPFSSVIRQPSLSAETLQAIDQFSLLATLSEFLHEEWIPLGASFRNNRACIVVYFYPHDSLITFHYHGIA